jgi:hypothetical protein
MAVITKTALAATPTAVVSTTLTASDTFTLTSGKRSILILRNPTAGAISPVITGSNNTAVPVAGYGLAPVAGGYTGFGSIAATTGHLAIELVNIEKWLNGTITVTAGTGLVATILEF